VSTPNDVPFVAPPPPNPQGNPLYPPEVLAAKEKEASEEARTALILSIVGIFCAGLILGIFAITKANATLKIMDQYQVALERRGWAVAARILGVIDIIGWAIILVLNIMSRVASS